MFSDDASGFVSIGEAIPDVILEIRYYSTFNFIGDRIDGYERPVALLTREAAGNWPAGDTGCGFMTRTVPRRRWTTSCAGQRMFRTSG